MDTLAVMISRVPGGYRVRVFKDVTIINESPTFATLSVALLETAMMLLCASLEGTLAEKEEPRTIVKRLLEKFSRENK